MTIEAVCIARRSFRTQGYEAESRQFPNLNAAREWAFEETRWESALRVTLWDAGTGAYLDSEEGTFCDSRELATDKAGLPDHDERGNYTGNVSNENGRGA